MESRNANHAGAIHQTCGECGHPVQTYWHEHSFRYGLAESAVDLTVQLPVRRCERCDFDYLDEEGERLKHEAVCRHLGVLSPAEVQRIRKRHGLSRQAFAKLSGIGEASLARWENGIKIQTLAYDRYLRFLAQPEGLAKLQQITSASRADAPAPSTFRMIEVSEALLQRSASFSLRLAA